MRIDFKVTQKYTVRSTGIWDRIRRALAVDPNRSSGVPLNPQYRNPPPGANPPEAYDDPVTIPAGDIADNAYFRRDIRRSYPRLSVVKQADVVGLLAVGSKANPKDDVLQLGDAGAKQLIEVRQEGEKGLAHIFAKDKSSISSVLGNGGMPPFPPGANRASPQGGKQYVMDADRENGYPEEYLLSSLKSTTCANTAVQISMSNVCLRISFIGVPNGVKVDKTIAARLDKYILNSLQDVWNFCIFIDFPTVFIFTWTFTGCFYELEKSRPNFILLASLGVSTLFCLGSFESVYTKSTAN